MNVLVRKPRELRSKPRLRCPLCKSKNYGFIRGAFRQIIVCYDCMFREYFAIEDITDIFTNTVDDFFVLDDYIAPPAQPPPPILKRTTSSLNQVSFFT